MREALVVLVEEGDFTVSEDPLRAAADHILQVRVDWEAFHSSRFSVRLEVSEVDDNS